ncbi:MAG: tetratricopeptide repeat protein [Phycisphaeraceae bacterium]|nr:tetratricopeptide repeat protein [Phycisphaeraceae bacterium]
MPEAPASEASNRPRRLLTAAGAVSLAAAALLVGVLSFQRIWPVDYWWQRGVGEYVLSHGVPSHDVFSYTNPQHPWLETRWGYCVALFSLTRALGHEAASIARTLIVLATFGLAAAAGLVGARRQGWALHGTVIAGGVVAVAAMASSQRMVVRPETVSVFFLAVFLWVIARRMQAPTRWVWVLPLVEAMWANTHGFFPLGPAVTGAWLVGETIEWALARAGWAVPDPDRASRVRQAGIITAIVGLAMLINPYGPRALLLPLTQFLALSGETAQKGYILELTSPFAFGDRYTALWWYKAMIGVATASVLLAPRRQRAFWLIVTGAMFALSAAAIRNIPLFAIAATAMAIRGLCVSPIWEWRPVARGAPWALAAGSIGLAIFCVVQVRLVATDRFAVQQRDTNQFGIGLARHRYPVRAIEFLKSTGATGPMFNSLGIGSYALAQGIPVFIDPRGEVFEQAILGEYREITEPPMKFDEYARKYGFRSAVIDTDAFPLITHIAHLPGWRLVYLDEVAAVLLRDDESPQTQAIDLARDQARWLEEARSRMPRPTVYESAGWADRVTSPVPYYRLGKTCFALGWYQAARSLFEDAIAAYPPAFAPEDLEYLVYTASLAGDRAASATYAQQWEARAPLDPTRARASMLALLKLGDAVAARPFAERLAKADPRDAEAIAAAGTVALMQSRFGEAERWIRQAVELSPATAGYHRLLGQSLAMQIKTEEAIRELSRALELDPGEVAAASTGAMLLSRVGRRDEALAWAERALKISPNDPQATQVIRSLRPTP